MYKKIVLKKVRVHNLKGIDLTLDPFQLIVFTGVSGSGKSSLVFDTIYVEGQRRYVESLSTYARRQLGALPKPDAELIEGISPTIAIEQKTAGKNPRSTVGTLTGIYDFMRVLYARIGTAYCPVSKEAVTPQSAYTIIHKIRSYPEKSKIILFSPYIQGKKGEFKEEFAELTRRGFMRVRLDGTIIELSEEIAIEPQVTHTIDLLIDRIVVEPANYPRINDAVHMALDHGKGVLSVFNTTTQEEELFSEHAYSEKSGLSYPPLEPHDFSFNHPSGMCRECHGLGFMQAEEGEMICPACRGDKIKPYPAATLLGKQTLPALTRMPIAACLDFFTQLTLSKMEETIAQELIKEITLRLHFLIDVGLHYLTLDRTAPTLSGGEAQRVRLSSQIGSGLVGTTYILDEPSIGLHPRDNTRLIATLQKLRDKGNTVIVVEHDEETIAAADTVVDIGPLAGSQGGEIVAVGNIEAIMQEKRSITGGYLSQRLKIEIPKKRRSFDQAITLKGARHHNLKNLSVKIPLGIFVGVTGVSGSGKSSLISDTLYPLLANRLNQAELPSGPIEKISGYESLDKMIQIDQSPIGRTPRSNPATYIKLFDEIRQLFSQLPEAAAQGFHAGRFSFNVKEGSCPHCLGMGTLKIDMDFMADEWENCPYCQGARFDERTLSVKYRGKNIHQILELTVSEAYTFFEAFPPMQKKLETLIKVGLDYIRLGQPSPTLSGGEAQRIKLAKELARPDTKQTFYILDEPTTGLHFHDIQKLIAVLQALVDRGNTVLVIEHNFDLIKTVDWVIDLGPEGGEEGGQIVAEGKPEKIAKLSTPTGIAMHKALFPQPLLAKGSLNYKKEQEREVIVKGAAQNNLKKVDVILPRNKITVCTGPSGSGKSSFAFETMYAEGQRRYTESLPSYAKQFIKQMQKPKVDSIEGLSASIAIEQRHHAGNPRSTLGTLTEIYDFLRILYAHLGTAYDPDTLEKIATVSKEQVVDTLLALPENTPLYILAPLIVHKIESLDTLQQEGFLRVRLNDKYYLLDETIPLDVKRKNQLFLVIDRLKVKEGIRQRLLEAVSSAAERGGGSFVVDTEEKDLFFNLNFSVASTGKSFPPITPHSFSFNKQEGMCLFCQGLGFQYGANIIKQQELMRLTPLQLIHLLWKKKMRSEPLDLFRKLLKEEKIDLHKPLSKLPEKAVQLLFFGSSHWIKQGALRVRWIGINDLLLKAAKSHNPLLKEKLLPLLEEVTCYACQGSRLNPLARHVKIEEITLPALCQMPLVEASLFLQKIVTPPFLKETMNQLLSRLHFLLSIGLGYLALERSAPTLSGGETQRVRLARQLGSGLTGVLYVLDEPTIGLHPHDNQKLNNALQELTALGNTLLLVEHDPLTIATADYLLDFGPKAGKAGGYITAQGTLEEIKKDPHSLTGLYLSGQKTIPLPKKRRSFTETITLKNVALHNLKGFDAHFPIDTFTCITGVSGSGKSTLMHALLKPYIKTYLYRNNLKNRDCDKKGSQNLHSERGTIAERQGQSENANSEINPTQSKTDSSSCFGITPFTHFLTLDQSPIGTTNRADISTYVDLLTPLRYLFAQLKEAKVRGLAPKHFSFNHIKGMCKACWGLGSRQITLQFLPPVKVKCEACKGERLNPLSLQVHYQGKNLGQILQMTIEEAKAFLPPQAKIERILNTLLSVGLGYLTLGQEIATLSGGEAQRIRLSKELAKRTKGKTLYLFDEPTTGLHSEDIARLLPIFHALVDRGHTLILIEHNLDLIAHADYILDLGPGAGKEGGYLVAEGTPEEIMANKNSLTGNYLSKTLTPH